MEVTKIFSVGNIVYNKLEEGKGIVTLKREVIGENYASVDYYIRWDDGRYVWEDPMVLSDSITFI